MSASLHILHRAPATTPATIVPDDSILRRPAVVKRCGLSIATIYRMIARKEFPAAVSLGGKSVGWRNSAINAWIAARDQAVR